jgi:hypothetical protein
MIEVKKQNKVLSKGELSSCHNHLWLKCQFVPQGITLILNTVSILHTLANYMININTGSHCLESLWCTKNVILTASSLSFFITTSLSLCVHTVALLSIKWALWLTCVTRLRPCCLESSHGESIDGGFPEKYCAQG